MASGANLLLQSEKRGKRQIQLDQTFFPAYRKTGIGPDELIRAIQIPFTNSRQHFRAYKQAQRREDDIAIVSGAFLVEFEEGMVQF
jgi:xanthine dehydrogenase/oxidase